MAIVPNPYKTTGFLGWIDDRFPLTKLWKDHLSEYYAPKNFNFWYYFGSLALLVLVNQLITGIVLTMHYKPGAETAFDSVEYIMRDVPWGNIIRYMHSTGASAFFIVVFMHMYRGLLYGSYKKPRELIWVFGALIFLVLMAEAFCGYVLPWGNMSYWGAQVIISLFGTIPVIGPDVVIWVQGDYSPADATLNRLFSLHVIALPFVLVGLVVAHLIALHEVGSNNPDGVEIKKHKDKATGIPLDGIPFHPYYTVKDIVGVTVFLMIFAGIIFWAPDGGGYFLEKPNFTPASAINTPEHITPAWYFGSFYAILRATPPLFGSALPGVIAMFGAVLVIFFVPWLDRSPVKSIRYKGPLFKIALTLFTIAFIALSYYGMQPPSPLGKLVSQIGSVVYFLFFFLMPVYTKMDSYKTEPERVTHDAH
ncbi:cytochrome bc complex cytochrome b subunit [Stagnimonas aquatica]|uniref:Cytochrome b n=1 Tax=Stagnimonas aquatica TaxID=2689987 RepID=A0A3N0VGZ0_9GAMM|nr:cytochrome bc complex cytochrome b subunit [Stagnimonas aquatica]ROH91975.1 cytochrome bc complex cytochrome b subunit [Stagnimonas aquatica]